MCTNGLCERVLEVVVGVEHAVAGGLEERTALGFLDELRRSPEALPTELTTDARAATVDPFLPGAVHRQLAG